MISNKKKGLGRQFLMVVCAVMVPLVIILSILIFIQVRVESEKALTVWVNERLIEVGYTAALHLAERKSMPDGRMDFGRLVNRDILYFSVNSKEKVLFAQKAPVVDQTEVDDFRRILYSDDTDYLGNSIVQFDAERARAWTYAVIPFVPSQNGVNGNIVVLFEVANKRKEIIRSLLQRYALPWILVIVVVFLAIFFIYLLIARPFSQLHKYLMRLNGMSGLEYKNYQEFAHQLAELFQQQKTVVDSVSENGYFLSESQRMAHIGSWSLVHGEGVMVWSSETYAICGLKQNSFIPSVLNFFDLVHSDDREQIRLFMAHEDPDNDADIDCRIVRPGGEVRTIKCHAKWTARLTERTGRLVGTMQDVTELKEADERFRRSFKLIPSPLTLQTLDGVIVDCNDEFCRISGKSWEEVLSGGVTGADLWVDINRRKKMRDLFVKHGYVNNFEFQIRDYAGRIRTLQMSSRHLCAGESQYVLSVAHDVTSLRSAEHALRLAEAQLSHFIQYAPCALAMFDTEMRYLHASEQWMLDSKIDKKSIIGHSHYEFFPHLPDRWKRAHKAALEGETLRVEDDRYQRADGSYGWLRWEVRPWYTAQNDIGGILIFSENISERKRIESALKLSNEQLDFALKYAKMGAWDINLKTQKTYHSLLHDQIFGYVDAVMNWNYDVFLNHVIEEERERVDDLFKSFLDLSANLQFETQIRRADGEVRWIEVIGGHGADMDGELVRISGVVHDTTERKVAEQHLEYRARQQEIVAELGQMALGNQSFEYLLKSIVAKVTEILQLPFCTILDRPFQSEALRFSAGVGWQQQDFNWDDRSAFAQGQYTLQQAVPIIINDLANEQRFDTEFLKRHGVASGVSIVIGDHQSVCGVLMVHSKIWRDFNHADVHFLQSVANLLAVAERRRTAEKKLQVSEARARALFNQTFEFIGLLSLDGILIEANSAALEIGGVSAGEVTGKPFWDGPWWKHSEAEREKIKQAVHNAALGEFVRFETTHIDSDGETAVVDFSLKPIQNGDGEIILLLPEGRDISEQKKAESSLSEQLKEKDALLKEVHHRVKNNLQVISSLLNLEIKRTQDAGTRNVLEEMKGRIRTMALLHQSLYSDGIFSAIDLSRYLQKIASQSFRSATPNKGHVDLDFDLMPVTLEMSQALPCGLIVNELISNSLKHAFPNSRPGIVRIQLVKKDNEVAISVSDNGVGLAQEFTMETHASLGLQLVSDLTRQLRGTLQIKLSEGACFNIRFSPKETR